MQKDWFLFRNDHHEGPFSTEMVIEKFKLGELNSRELIWSEGQRHWAPLEDHPNFSFLFHDDVERTSISEGEDREEYSDQNLWIPDETLTEEEFAGELSHHNISEDEESPPELPPASFEDLPPDIPIEYNEAIEEEEKEEEEVDVPPPLPLEGIDSASQLLTQLEEIEDQTALKNDIEEEDDFDDLEESCDETISEKTWPLGIVSALGILGILLSWWWLQKLSIDRASLRNLSVSIRENLERAWRVDYLNGRPVFRVGMDNQEGEIWLTTNYPGQGVVFLSLKSQKGKIIGKGVVQASSKAALKNGAARFRNLKLNKGLNLSKGYYDIQIKLLPLGPKEKVKQITSSKKGDGLKLLKHEDTFLLYNGAESDFKKRLKNYKRLVEKNKLRPLNERLITYNTMLALLDRMGSAFQKILKEISRGKGIQKFEGVYNQEIGPFLRDLIIESNRLHISLLNVKPKESYHYEEEMNYGKDIGGVASDMVKSTEKYKRLSKANKGTLKNLFTAVIEELRKKGESKVKLIEAELGPYKELLNK
jgi:hypothetical protein